MTHILQKFQFNKYWLQRDCTLEGIQYECLYTPLFSISLSDHNDLLAHDSKFQQRFFIIPFSLAYNKREPVKKEQAPFAKVILAYEEQW